MALSSALLAALLLALAQPSTVPDTDTVYGDAQSFETGDGRHLTTYQQRADDLILPTGAIVAWDAIVIIGAQPFERTVEPGRYKVMLTVSQDDQADKRVAFARIELLEGQPVRWEPATLAGEDPAQAHGYSVDSGTGAFMDAQTAAQATQDFDTYGNALLRHLTEVVNRDEYWTSVVVDPASGGDAVAFTSGYGDGGYASYWGFDAKDDVVCLVTDFSVLTDATRVQ